MTHAASMSASASVSDGMNEDIALSRFKQSLFGVIHENELLERRVHDLERRLLERAEDSKSQRAQVADLQNRLDDAMRKEEEVGQRAAAQEKAAEDERVRHVLHARLAGEKATTAQAKLQAQGQQLYALEEQLRTRTAEASRLRIEKEGAESLIETFQGRLEEVSRVIDATTQAEKMCKEAIDNMRSDQTAMQQELRMTEATLQAASSRERLELLLKKKMREAQQARDLAQEKAGLLDSRQREVEAMKAALTSTAAQLNAAEEKVASSHARELAVEDQRRQLVESLHRAQGGSLRLAEKSEGLMRRLDHSSVVTQILLRELAHADANAHKATAHADTVRQAADGKVHAAERLLASKVQLVAETEKRLEESGDEAARRSAALTSLKEELHDAKHRITVLETSLAA